MGRIILPGLTVEQVRGRTPQRAFSIIELLVAVAIVAMLATVGAFQISRARMAAREQLAITNLRTLAKACHFFFLANGQYPAALTELGSPVSTPPYVDPSLAQATPVKQGYTYTYTRVLPGEFMIQADPQVPGAGNRCFFVDQTSVIRGDLTCPATAGSPQLP